MKTIKFSFLSILLILQLVCHSQTAKILSVSFFASKSFRNAVDPLHSELADRGHQITIINPIPATKTHKNIREINLPTKKASPLDVSKFSDFFERREKKEVSNIILAGPQIVEACHQFLQMIEIQDLIKKEKFDLIFGVAIGNECSYGYIHQFNTSFILLSPITPAFHVSAISGVPSPVSFVPSIFTGLSDRMNFFDRVNNFFTSLWYEIFLRLSYIPQMDEVNRQYYGEKTPTMMDIAKNMSLMLVGSHFSVNYLRPFMPDMIDIGGLYCKPAKPLPKDILDFVESSGDDGFIYFSMGSVLQGSAMPDRMRQTFVNVFRELKQKVLWKWETETMDNLPENVKLLKWAPQQDILGHSKIRLFISHAGGLSTSEATYNGVPIIGIPMFGDQDYNILLAQNKGYGLKLELGDVTEESLMKAIQRVLTDSKFAKTAKLLSGVFQDKQNTALETAVYWTEYVIRHNGAPHLRSPARDLNFFQFYSLDVIAFSLAILSLAICILYTITKLILKSLSKSSKAKAD